MRKTTYLKTLLVAACLCLGSMSAWADPIETIGSTSSGWWTDFSSTYTLEGYGKYHFQFTTTNANDGNVWKTWLLVATDGDYPSSYTGKGGGHTGVEYFVWRGEGYAWGQGTDSNATPSKLVCSNTYSTANPTGAGIQAAMNGASVDMVITRESNNIYATATVTPSNGENEFTMSFKYLYGNATSANVGLFLTVENAQVVLNTAEQTAEWSTVWSTDFSSAPSGMTYTISAGSCNITNGYLWYKNDAGSGDRTQTASFTDSKFNVDTNWIMEFDWNCGQSNSKSSNVTFATNKGNAFTLSWNNNGNGQVTVTNASSTGLTTTLPVAGYNISSISSWSHIVITGNTENGVYLTITNGSTTYVNNALVTSTFGYPVSFNGTLGKSVAAMGMDNISFKTPTVAGFVSTPTYEITGANGNERQVTLSCLTDGAVIKYNTTDDKSAAGWTAYSTPFYTEETTLYAYSEKSATTSDVIEITTGAGTTLKLNTPIISKTAYADGDYTISISSDQSSVAIVPASPSVKYSIDGGSAQTYTTSFAVASGKTVKCWVENTGYTNSDEASTETAARPSYYATTWMEDYRNVTSDAGTGPEIITLGDDSFTIDEVDFKNIVSYGSPAVDVNLNTNVGLNTTTGVNLRCNGVNSGILVNNTSTAKIGIRNLKIGDYIVLTVTGVVPTAAYGCTLQEGMSILSEYYFLATETSASINIPKGTYNYVYTIKVLSSTVSKTITAAGWATYCSPCVLDFSSSIDNLTAAYTITGNEGAKLTLAPITGTIPANTGILLEGEGVVTIPVVANSSTDVSANKLVGVTAEYALAAEGGYVLMGSPNVGFYKNTNAFTVGANTAYLPVGFGTGYARSFFSFDDEETTGIESLANSQKLTANGEFFDLQGRRVAQPTKGLYIVNGRKIVIK